MTHSPDDPDDPADGGRGGRDPGAGRRLDEDAAWRDIVAHYGDRPELPDEEPPARGPQGPEPSDDARLRGLFRTASGDPLQSAASWDDEGHFVPPEPPPVVVQDPRRRLAWAGLFGSPLIMLVSVVLGWKLPDWLMFGLAASLVGGFVYLVATMPKRGPGDDGAVV